MTSPSKVYVPISDVGFYLAGPSIMQQEICAIYNAAFCKENAKDFPIISDWLNRDLSKDLCFSEKAKVSKQQEAQIRRSWGLLAIVKASHVSAGTMIEICMALKYGKPVRLIYLTEKERTLDNPPWHGPQLFMLSHYLEKTRIFEKRWLCSDCLEEAAMSFKASFPGQIIPDQQEPEQKKDREVHVKLTQSQFRQVCQMVYLHSEEGLGSGAYRRQELLNEKQLEMLELRRALGKSVYDTGEQDRKKLNSSQEVFLGEFLTSRHLEGGDDVEQQRG